jgi:hypothetical protein
MAGTLTPRPPRVNTDLKFLISLAQGKRFASLLKPALRNTPANPLWKSACVTQETLKRNRFERKFVPLALNKERRQRTPKTTERPADGTLPGCQRLPLDWLTLAMP